MVDDTLFLPGLSPLCGKPVVARFDGGRLSSEGGLLALREAERRLGLAARLAKCVTDRRAPGRVRHRLSEIIGFRMLMIAAGYEDGNDADTLRRDPMFKLALERLPSEADLCSQSTISRLENLPDRRALLRLARALVEQYCGAFRAVPKRIVLDIDFGPMCPDGTDEAAYKATNLHPARPPARPQHRGDDAAFPVKDAEANQFRLFLHAGAYWLLWSIRRVMPKRSLWRVAQFDTLRLRLIKLAARVVELKTQIKIHLPSSAPDQAIFATLLDRLPRLVT